MDASLASYSLGVASNWEQTTVDFINEPPEVDFDNPQTAAAATNVMLNAFRDEMAARIMASDLPDAVKEDAVAKLDMMINSALQVGVDADVQGTVQEVFGDTATQVVKDLMADIFLEMMQQDLMEQTEEGLSSGSEEGQPAPGAAGAEAGGTAEGGETEAGGSAESAGGSEGSSSAGGGSGNWLVKLAQALADVQNKHLDNLMAATEKAASAAEQDTAFTEATDGSGTNSAGQTEEQVAEGNATSRAEYIRANAEVTAYSRLFSMSSETTSNVIKTVGEGLTSIARKQ